MSTSISASKALANRHVWGRTESVGSSGWKLRQRGRNGGRVAANTAPAGAAVKQASISMASTGSTDSDRMASTNTSGSIESIASGGKTRSTAASTAAVAAWQAITVQAA